MIRSPAKVPTIVLKPGTSSSTRPSRSLSSPSHISDDRKLTTTVVTASSFPGVGSLTPPGRTMSVVTVTEKECADASEQVTNHLASGGGGNVIDTGTQASRT